MISSAIAPVPRTTTNSSLSLSLQYHVRGQGPKVRLQLVRTALDKMPLTARYGPAPAITSSAQGLEALTQALILGAGAHRIY